MLEKPNTPKQYTDGFVDLINSEPHYDRNERQLSGPIVLEEDENFSVLEYVKCNRKKHWREHVTVNKIDNTVKVKVDSNVFDCDCLN